LPSYTLSWSTGQTPLEQWRYTHWSNIGDHGSGADASDVDGDGVANLIEYALGGTPTSPSLGILPTCSVVPVSSAQYLRLSFSRDPSHTDLTYTIQASTDLVNWTNLAASSNGQVMTQLNASGATITDTGTSPTQAQEFTPSP